MSLLVIIRWLFDPVDPLNISDKILTADEIIEEHENAEKNDRPIIAQLRIASSEKSDLFNEIKQKWLANRTLKNFCELSLPYLKTHPESSLYLLTIHYLLTIPEQEKPLNWEQKLFFLFNSFLERNKQQALDYYYDNLVLFDKQPEIKHLVLKIKKLESDRNAIKEQFNRLKITLSDQQDPLGLVQLLRTSLGDIQQFTALLLWLLEKKVPIDTILSTHLLHDFLAYNIFDLDKEDSPIHDLFVLLYTFPQTSELIHKAVCVSSGLRGQETRTLTGSINSNQPLMHIDKILFPLNITSTALNFEALFQLFGHSFLHAACLSYLEQADKNCHSLLKIYLNERANIVTDLPRLINEIAQYYKPVVLKNLADLLNNATLNELIAQKCGAVLHLLPYKPQILKQITTVNFAEFLAEINKNYASTLEVIYQLIVIFKIFHQKNHPALELVFSSILENLYHHPQLTEDSELINNLKKYPFWARQISNRIKLLQQQLFNCISENTKEGKFGSNIYPIIEEVWLETSNKLWVLNQFFSLSNADLYDKYVLFGQIARSVYQQNKKSFDLDGFIGALPLSDEHNNIDASCLEMMLFELLTVLDDEIIRDQVIDKLTNEPLACHDWLDYQYNEAPLLVKVAKEGNKGLLHFIYERKIPDQPTLAEAIIAARENNQWEVVTILWPKTVITKEILLPTLERATAEGAIFVVSLLADSLIDLKVTPNLIEHSLLNAIINGDLFVLRLLCGCISFTPKDRALLNKLFSQSIDQGHYDLADYLCSLTIKPEQVTIDKIFMRLITNNNHFGVTCFFKLSELSLSKRIIENGFKKAVLQGFTELVDLLLMNSHSSFCKEFIAKAINLAASHGHVAIMNRLLTDKRFAKSSAPLTTAWNCALQNKQWDCVKNLRPMVSQKTFENSLFQSVKRRQLDKLVFLTTLLKGKLKNAVIEKMLSEACRMGELKFVEHLCNVFSPSVVFQRKMLIIASKAGQLHIVNYLFEATPELKGSPASKVALRVAKSTLETELKDNIEDSNDISVINNKVRVSNSLKTFGLFHSPNRPSTNESCSNVFELLCK